jgi:hypothetical protein
VTVSAPAAAQTDTSPPAPRDDRRAVAIAIALLIALPAIVFGGADLIGGHLLLAGDNLIQNYPLRVLVGSQLRSGHLPVWDPYVFGGTPLMAGLNAGAFFPTTLLFVVLTAHAAWVLGEILLYSSVGVGTFLLFRSGGAAVLPCLLGAATFAFAGAVTTQISVHYDMGGGVACLPWALLAVRRIVEDGRWRWCALLAAALGLSVLAGSPEALLGTIAATATFGVLHWSLRPGSGWRFVSRSAVSVSAAVGGSAFAWLPALRFIAVSQRASVSEVAASGFAFPPRAGILALVPFLEGGDKLVGQGAYFGPSNSGEVTLYIGILPVVAVIALISRRWSARLPQGERRCWYGVMVVAAVLAVAAGTPLEHLIYHVPFYGRQRNSGRSVLEVDLAASALFAWWVDGGRGAADDRPPVQRVAGLLPLAAVLAVGTWFAVAPSSLWQALTATASSARPAGVTAAIVVAVGIALVAACVALLRPRVPRRLWLVVVSAATIVDLGLFSGGSAYLSSHAVAEPPSPGPVVTLVSRSLSPGGRYALFDPSLYDPSTTALAGEPDSGILEQLPSAEGYGSLVDNVYAARTATTNRDYISPAGIAAGTFSDIGLQVIVTVPESFLTPIVRLPQSAAAQVVAEPPGTDPVLPGGDLQAPGLPIVRRTSAPRPPLSAGQTTSWWFGTTVGVTAVLVQFPPASADRAVRVGLVGAAATGLGPVRWSASQMVPAGAAGVLVPFAGGPAAEGIAVQLGHGPALGPLSVSVAAGSRAYLVNGALADTLLPGAWLDVGSADGFSVFRSSGPAPRVAWLDGAAGAVAVTARSVSTLTVAVHAGAAGRLVVGTAYDSGWHATVTAAGTSAATTVERDGLVQSVAVPAGASTVTLSYSAPGLPVGAAISAATLLVVFGLVIGLQVSRRRRSRGGRGDQPPQNSGLAPGATAMIPSTYSSGMSRRNTSAPAWPFTM